MNTTVEVKVTVDIEDVYNELSCADQEQFLVNHATDIAGELDTLSLTETCRKSLKATRSICHIWFV